MLLFSLVSLPRRNRLFAVFTGEINIAAAFHLCLFVKNGLIIPCPPQIQKPGEQSRNPKNL